MVQGGGFCTVSGFPVATGLAHQQQRETSGLQFIGSRTVCLAYRPGIQLKYSPENAGTVYLIPIVLTRSTYLSIPGTQYLIPAGTAQLVLSRYGIKYCVPGILADFQLTQLVQGVVQLAIEAHN